GGAGAGGSLHDLLRRRLDRGRVVGLQPDTDLVLGGGCHGSSLCSVCCGWGRVLWMVGRFLCARGRPPAERLPPGPIGAPGEQRAPRREPAPPNRRLSLPDGAVLVVSDCQLCVAPIHRARVLLDDLADHTRADGATALADGETQTLIHGDRLDQF